MLPLLTGRMYLFYGNKTSVQFVTFTTTVTCPGELQSHILHIYTCKHMFILAYTCCDKVNFICHGDYLRMLVACWFVAIPWLIPQLNVQTKPVEPLIEGGAQVQQVINIECLSDFCDAPLLNIKFRWQMHAFKWFTMVNEHTLRFIKLLCYLRYGGALQNLTLKLPVTINKFFQPTEMASHDFFQRWKQLSQ